jgi:hypothetical protein
MRTKLLVLVAVLGCKKHDSGNAQKIFQRWELGWRKSEACILGKVGRNKDAATQAMLAQLYDERGDCPNWFSDSNHDIANVSALDDDKKRGEALSDAENAVNTFTELAPEDLTDEQATAMTDLIAAVDNTRLHWPEGVAELVAARDKVRGLLGMPPSSWDITAPTTIADVKLGPPGQPAKPASRWKVDMSTNPPAVLDNTGKKLFSFKRGTSVDLLADPESPIAWQHAFEPDGSEQEVVTVFQGTAKTDVHHVTWIGNGEHRLDLLTGLTDPTWTWFAPGKQQGKPVKLTGIRRPGWACASDNALWVMTESDDGPIVVRYDLDGTPAKPAVASPGSANPTCDDAAVTYNSNRVICSKGHDCEVETSHGLESQLLEGRVVTLVGNQRSDLFVIHVSRGVERVFRATGAGKARAGGLVIRDRKPYVELTDGREAAIPWPLDK